MEKTVEGRKVRVFAAYQIGTGIHAKMAGDEEMNKFDVTPGVMSEMVREVEGVLAFRHSCEVKKGLVIIVHHVQLIGGL